MGAVGQREEVDDSTGLPQASRAADAQAVASSRCSQASVRVLKKGEIRVTRRRLRVSWGGVGVVRARTVLYDIVTLLLASLFAA